MDLSRLFGQFGQIKVGVVGDMMLDTYLWGHVERISPEAPVPVVALERRENRIGGAGNVALNLVSLGAKVATFSVLGADADGEQLGELLRSKGIDTRYLLKSENRITTAKARVMGRNQQMLRLDSETTADLTTGEEDDLLGELRRFLEMERPQVVIFEDYNKGVLTHRVIREAVALCRRHEVVTAVDPKRKNFFSYEGVTIFKPNLKEVKDGLNLLLEDVKLPVLRQIHEQLKDRLQHEISFITLSEKGVFFQYGEQAEQLPSHLRNIADVSGAGDTVVAVASLIYAATRDVRLMAEIANIAGGLVCEEVGTAAINKSRLLEECKRLISFE
ncbi:bifunctional heptose 7-phosphate kinase/heptose 1-phosphate adenyltransferase [Puia sp.]|jgi:rfaE bifunctional protein kinase chain/domain|uniref:bifunctional heptose 7-phosphate kinase/heptose 1-phosphate adenyltransferase n=1 Tax=Puia sp. TaxID=2045100 RepID=UPI002F40A8AE